MVRLVRRMVRKVGMVTLLSWGWNHRGSLVRSTDMLRRAPQLLQTGRTGDLTTEVRAIVALDGPFPADTDIRISAVDEGAVTLRDTLVGPTLEEARGTLSSVRDVLDVRTEATEHPTLDDALAAVGR